jgi:hypothetical protein
MKRRRISVAASVLIMENNRRWQFKGGRKGSNKQSVAGQTWRLERGYGNVEVRACMQQSVSCVSRPAQSAPSVDPRCFCSLPIPVGALGCFRSGF